MELKLKLIEPTEEMPPEYEPIFFVLDKDDRILFGSFAGNTFFQNPMKEGANAFRQKEVKFWAKIPKRLPNVVTGD